MNLNFRMDFLARLWRGWSGEKPIGVRAPSEVDYLVKMNLPPRLGRRDAACVQLTKLLTKELRDRDPEARAAAYRELLKLLEYALMDTEAIARTLASAETLSREGRLLTFLNTLRDLIYAALTLSQAAATLRERESPLTYFIGANRPARFVSLSNDSELRVLSLAGELIERSLAKLELYRDYNRKSFSTANAERYQRAYDEFFRSYAETFAAER